MRRGAPPVPLRSRAWRGAPGHWWRCAGLKATPERNFNMVPVAPSTTSRRPHPESVTPQRFPLVRGHGGCREQRHTRGTHPARAPPCVGRLDRPKLDPYGVLLGHCWRATIQIRGPDNAPQQPTPLGGVSGVVFRGNGSNPNAGIRLRARLVGPHAPTTSRCLAPSRGARVTRSRAVQGGRSYRGGIMTSGGGERSGRRERRAD